LIWKQVRSRLTLRPLPYSAVRADLRDVFNWNMKQLFVWVNIEYETESRVRTASAFAAVWLIDRFWHHIAQKFNQVSIWDRIIRNREDAKLSLKGEVLIRALLVLC
jgi:hypothetical protein